MKKALITGIGGQDGSYLAGLLLEQGYEVHGIELPIPGEERAVRLRNISNIFDRIYLHFGSVDDKVFLSDIVQNIQPDECYHLAASSFVSFAFEDEEAVLGNNISSTHALLGVLKANVPQCRLFFAGTSEMFGHAEVSPQDEATPFMPRSIYGISKLSGHHLIRYYRDHHGLFACTGILYNHESLRRGFQFVTRKITSMAAKIKLGLETKLSLGNLDALRDWGYAPDYVRAMWQMLQRETPGDYVIASGENHSVREFVEVAFERVGLDYRDYVEVDPRFFREAEKVPLQGNPQKALSELGWRPTKTFKEIVEEMVENDLELLKKNTNEGSNE
jgi:GDPmannose 4,6-dehydratase